MVSWGDLAMDRAQKSLRPAKYLEEKDKDQKAKHLAEARAALEDAQKQFKTAGREVPRALASLPARAEDTRQEQQGDPAGPAEAGCGANRTTRGHREVGDGPVLPGADL